MTQAVAAVAVTAVAVKSSVSGVEAGGGCVGDSREKDDLRQQRVSQLQNYFYIHKSRCGIWGET